MYSFVVLKCGGFIKRVKRSKPFTIYVSPQCLQTTFAAKPGSFFPLSNLSLCITTNISTIKPQSELNPSYITKGSFGGKVYCNRTFIKIFLTVLANRLFCILGIFTCTVL